MILEQRDYHVFTGKLPELVRLYETEGIAIQEDVLGGFVPPLIMGWVYGQTQSYAIGLWLLSGTAAFALALTLTSVRRLAQKKEVVA